MSSTQEIPVDAPLVEEEDHKRSAAASFNQETAYGWRFAGRSARRGGQGAPFAQFSTLLAGLLLLANAGCTSQPTETDFIIDPLLAPVPQAPSEGRAYSFRSADAPPMVFFDWRHGMPTAQIPNPHQAERIIICVYDEQRGECESGTREGVPKPIWFEAAADDPKVNRAAIKQERNPFVRAPDMHLGYEFRTSLRMRPEYRDRRLLWQVGACASGTCRMSDPRSLRGVTRGQNRWR